MRQHRVWGDIERREKALGDTRMSVGTVKSVVSTMVCAGMNKEVRERERAPPDTPCRA